MVDDDLGTPSYSISKGAHGWIQEFLKNKGLQRPDGRALYAYRCTEEEFNLLAVVLRQKNPHSEPTVTEMRAFVLYASEWWQKKYDGHHWSWEPLLASIDWKDVHYTDLYSPIREAWRWWGIDLVRVTSSTRYLGTIACQGGLPLALVGDGKSKITQYLRAVLKHTVSYQKFVDDPIVLAQDQQHLLRPPTLHRDYVFRLAADLIAAVIDLQPNAQGGDPIDSLDRDRPGWRDTMPMALGNTDASNLLKGLLHAASQESVSRVDDFRVERFLRQTSVGWRLGARIRSPKSIRTIELAQRIGVPELELPPRFEVRIQGKRTHVVGWYAARTDDYVLAGEQSTVEVWDDIAADEFNLHFISGDVISKPVPPYKGSALGSLPWVFRDDDGGEYPFVGEGTVSNRSPKLITLVSDECTATNIVLCEEEQIFALDRSLWRVDKQLKIDTGVGICTVSPGSNQVSDEEYRFSGSRFYDLECNVPLFRDTPKLRLARPGQVPRVVNASEISWKQSRHGWQDKPDSYGLWHIRHIKNGELRFHDRVGLLPERFSLTLEAGQDTSQGRLIFGRTDGARFSGQGEEVTVDVRRKGDGDNTVLVDVSSRETTTPPPHVRLHINWQGATELLVQAPFPGLGGYFLRDDEPLDGEIAVNELYGVRATAITPARSKAFRIDGELKAQDLEGDLRKIVHFNKPLKKTALIHEIPLSNVRQLIESLLAASPSSDAFVELNIIDNFGIIYSTAKVCRFSAELEREANTMFVSVSPPLTGEASVAYEALPIARPEEDSISLPLVGPVGDPHGAELPQDMDLNEPWLIVVRHDDKVRVRPIVVGQGISTFAGVRNANMSGLAGAVSIEGTKRRTDSIDAAMDAMLENDDAQQCEEDWSFLTESLLLTEGLPPGMFDLIKCLVKKQRLLIRAIFRLDSAPRQMLWQLENELPFSWLLFQRDVWWHEAKQECTRLTHELKINGIDNGEQMARDHISKILREGNVHNTGLGTLLEDVSLRLKGSKLSDRNKQDILAERGSATPSQIKLRASMDDWPKGYCRNDWIQKLMRGKLLNILGKWQDYDEPPVRQPLFDTPVAAAWCSIFNEPTDPIITYLVKHIRAHDPEWFDVAYRAAWVQLALIADKLKGSQ